MSLSIIKIDFKNLQPKDVFEWLEKFGFSRYGVRYFVDPSKRDDPRYPAERYGSPKGWYTHLPVTRHCYNRDMFIIDEETYEKIKACFKAALEEPYIEIPFLEDIEA